MSELFLFNTAGKILWKLGTLTLQEFCFAQGIEKEINKLEDTLSAIQAVLLDAEEQQAKSRQLSNWLEKLEHAFYVLDDVLDEFEIVAQRWRVFHGSIKRKVRNFFNPLNPIMFRFRMGHKIREIREKLEEVAAEKGKFHLKERDVEEMHKVRKIREREETHSFERQSNVLGRDDDKENIVQLLMHSSHHDQNVSVIPIVGIGGLGKTTLARMVYNDDRIVEHFQVKIWVCVLDDFDLKKLCANIIKIATNDQCDNLNMEQLQIRLRDSLRNKKFLLVLDDVWNEDYEKWDELKNLLMDGAQGSKIVVTTRSQMAAQIVGTIPTYNLKSLSEEDCLSLFLKRALREGQEREHPNLVKIGEEIVKKCKGVPLAAKTLGSLLFMKTDERDWLFIRDNEIWRLKQKETDILPALKLSYDQLPSHLKQCFAYCSIFPKDFEFSNVQLIQLWMAEGLIQSSEQKAELEEIGEGYIRELSSRSFIENTGERYFIRWFKMHDLVHDLALSLAQTEFSVVNSSTEKISSMVRHISFSDPTDESEFGEEVPRCLLQLNHLRTIYFPFVSGRATQTFVNTCMSRFKYLRVLELNNSCFAALPKSIGNLKHLRYLDLLSNTNIKRLPNSICKLQSLQTLNLGCDELEVLPKNIGRLISLRSLVITTKQKCLPEKGIRRLTSLRTLSITNCRNIKHLPEGMQHLTALRTLVISGCESLVSLPRGMQNLVALENLLIVDCGKLNLMMEDEEARDIEGLRSLRQLWIQGLPELVSLPKWLLLRRSAIAAPSTLQRLHIEECLNLTRLPEWLENLSSLRKLEIVLCPELTSLPEEMRHLTALRQLRIQRCRKLSRRCVAESGKDWHTIAHVREIHLDEETSDEGTF